MMAWKRVSLTFCCVALLCSPAFGQGRSSRGPVLQFHASAGDPFAKDIEADARTAMAEIAAFFGAPFADPVTFDLVGTRAAFDAAVKRFGLSPTQCWMVGVGTGDLMAVLSPAGWKADACEHDPANVAATRMLVKHELIHVYHGQRNASRDFTGLDDLDWFIEGLAVYGAGQLTPDRLAKAEAAAAAGQLPAALAKVWTGPDRYGSAGSLVRYIDQTWGRATTVRLLKARSTAEALTMLGRDEPALLEGWRTSLRP
jgi:hypothetical protein